MIKELDAVKVKDGYSVVVKQTFRLDTVSDVLRVCRQNGLRVKKYASDSKNEDIFAI